MACAAGTGSNVDSSEPLSKPACTHATVASAGASTNVCRHTCCHGAATLVSTSTRPLVAVVGRDTLDAADAVYVAGISRMPTSISHTYGRTNDDVSFVVVYCSVGTPVTVMTTSLPLLR